ncbi:MAG: hypothetical protein WC375_04300, partial [Methanomassiliicoccales archaeon]
MKKTLADLKLAGFFAQLRLEKKAASLGHFNDVVTDADIDKHARLVSELLKLPKYQEVINRLHQSNGVINFVTNNEFEPLV